MGKLKWITVVLVVIGIWTVTLIANEVSANNTLTTSYENALISCGNLKTIEKRNYCRFEVTRKYRYGKE